MIDVGFIIHVCKIEVFNSLNKQENYEWSIGKLPAKLHGPHSRIAKTNKKVMQNIFGDTFLMSSVDDKTNKKVQLICWAVKGRAKKKVMA